jgi:hypothetical protein
MDELEKKVVLLRNKLDIAKINHTISKIKLDKVYEEIENGLTQEYYYRKIIIRQIELYKESVKNAEKFDVFNNIVLQQKLKLIKLTNVYIKYKDHNYLKNADIAVLEEDNARSEYMNCMHDLLEAILDMVGDQGDSVISEVKSIINLI